MMSLHTALPLLYAQHFHLRILVILHYFLCSKQAEYIITNLENNLDLLLQRSRISCIHRTELFYKVEYR